MLETGTAMATLRSDGVVQITIRSGAAQSLTDAQANVAAIKSLSAGIRRPLLIDMSGARPLEPEVRHFYGENELSTWFTAMALIIESTALGRMMGNVYLRVARTGLPTQLFTDEASASAWLAKFPSPP
jgi:hypothetical protein